MVVEKILLPYNFMGNDQKALNFVIRTFAPRKNDIEITLFNSFTPPPQIEATRSTVMEKLRTNINFTHQQIKEQKNDLLLAKKTLVRSGFSESNIRTLFKPRTKDIATEIIDTALSLGSTIVVLNRKPGRVTRFFTGSIFNKVVTSLGNKTICVVS
jgi:hypothetical protein